MAAPVEMPASPVDTISAIATATGGGVGIVRLSGPHAEGIVARLVRPWPSHPDSHRLYHGHVHLPETGERVDEVLACVMRRPHSYTGDDVGELHGHGGAVVLGRLLEATLKSGARLALPGEFTRRAFENGRIDLTRAEAVAEVIAARTQRALEAAQALREGALELAIRSLRERLVGALAEMEGAIDFPDERLDAQSPVELALVMRDLEAEVSALSRSHASARLLGGARAVLVGRVNAGKSSLFNALVGRERALVDAAPGTTRDAVEAVIDLAGIPLQLIDTAGERFTRDLPAGGAAEADLERRGIELGRGRLREADATLLVVDGTIGFGEGEQELWSRLPERPRLIVWNKRDCAGPATGLPDGAAVVETAAPLGMGIEALRRALGRLLGERDPDAGVQVVSARHAEALGEAAMALGRAAEALEADHPLELGAVDAHAALSRLGLITGETASAELLDAIFARFCIGK